MSIYKQCTPDELNELFSNYLIDSWSYSKVSTFSRNEKAFEMQYIYGQHPKFSSTSVAGSAYHKSLQRFFEAIKSDGNAIDAVELEAIAFEHIKEQPANKWKVQKTTPTIEDCQLKATDISIKLIRNFLKEVGTYTDDLAEVLDVEIYCDEFLTVNGVDIPLPCHGVIDLVIKTDDGKVVVIDHKSKAAYSSDDEVALVIGRQAITYALLYESRTGTKVDEVRFFENKHSQNKNGSPQIHCFKVELNDNTRKLYEALLYEPLRRLLTAVSDPNYVYLINDSDNMVDKAELYDFWAKTMISEIEDFNVAESKKDLVAKRLKKIRDASISTINPGIIKIFREKASDFIQYDYSNTNMTNEQKIEHCLRTFGVIAQVAHTLNGFSSTSYLLEVSAGVKVASIHSRRLDIANAMDVPSVRISSNLVMHQGKSYLAIESAIKREKTLLWDAADLSGFKIPIGKSNYGEIVHWDLENHSTPHVLVCGATGSGKSVMIKSTIEYAIRAGVTNIIIMDPKHEFKNVKFSKGIIVYSDIDDIETAMQLEVEYMNELVKNGKQEKRMIIFDEFADAVSASRSGNDLKIYEMKAVGLYKNGTPKVQRVLTGELKSLEENLRMLLQKGRSSGYRILAATQRASTKVITGDAKVNFPVQVCFRVPKETDSRVVLDEPGAESLSGYGDGLIKSPEYSDTVRFQGYFLA